MYAPRLGTITIKTVVAHYARHIDAPGALELEELVALLITDPRRAERKKSNSHGARVCAQKRSLKLHLPFEPLSDLLSVQLLLIHFSIDLHVFPA